MNKLCSVCKKDKNSTEFYPSQNKCKKCYHEYSAAQQRALNYLPDPSIIEKKCSICNEVKSIAEFNRYRRRKDGYDRRCKSCTQKECTTLETRFSSLVCRAKRRNIPVEIDINFVKTLPLICQYTGDILTLEPNKRNTFSFDRVDSSKGYTKTNTVPCCEVINTMKTDLPLDQFLLICKKIVEHAK